jgi:hypothetical protein
MGTPLFAPEVAAKRDIRAVGGLPQSVSRRFGGRRLLGRWPETGLEKISGDFLEADLNEAALRQTLSRAGCQRCVWRGKVGS